MSSGCWLAMVSVVSPLRSWKKQLLSVCYGNGPQFVVLHTSWFKKYPRGDFLFQIAFSKFYDLFALLKNFPMDSPWTLKTFAPWGACFDGEKKFRSCSVGAPRDWLPTGQLWKTGNAWVTNKSNKIEYRWMIPKSRAISTIIEGQLVFRVGFRAA